MGKKNQLKEFEYSGILDSIIKDFINEKRAIGLKYNLQARILKRFDTFSKSFDLSEKVLLKDIVEKWLQKTPNETHQNQKLRIWTIRQLGFYMQRHGYEVYIPSTDMLGGTRTNFVPYIFTEGELTKFFKQADSIVFQKQSPNKHLVIPILFRILYGCGLRVSEATSLRIKDVDIETGVLKILYAKFNHQRIVPMSDALIQRCKKYLNIVHITSRPGDIFLSSAKKNIYAQSLIYREFRKLLWKAGISHGGKGNGPRIHDFRHTFAVHCLKKWVLNGVDVAASLPVLSAYLGHANLKGTQHYLRLTADLFPEITSKIEENLDIVFPKHMEVMSLKPTNFSKHITTFLSEYLPTLKNVSKNTISSYCDTFKLLLKYCRDCRNISPEKLSLESIDVELIKAFLIWLEVERECSISTRNQRLAAIHSFMRYVQAESPENMLHCQRVLDISFKKKNKPAIKYLSADDVKLILEQPDLSSQDGRRDLVLLCIMYDTGARVQEIADLIVRNVRLEYPAKIHLTGKGRKSREVPLLSKTANLLHKYLLEQKLQTPDKLDYPLFCNRQREKLTRAGISYILNKYVQMAKIKSSLIPEKVTPHVLRHTKAMHLLQAGVNLVYIRDILGHVDISTTEVYARADTEMKRIALEKAHNIEQPSVPSWTNDTDLLNWLKEYGKIKN